VSAVPMIFAGNEQELSHDRWNVERTTRDTLKLLRDGRSEESPLLSEEHGCDDSKQGSEHSIIRWGLAA
jgi:hypothetical protein